MPDEPAIEVLPYAAATRQRGGRRLNAVALIGGALVLCLYYLGLVPAMSWFAFDYTKTIGLPTAVREVIKVPPWKLVADPYTSVKVWFIPFAVGALVGFVVARRPRAKLILAGVALGVSVLGGSSMMLVSPIAFFIIAPAAVLGRCDGEDWSEGLVAYAAMGGWIVLWTLIMLAMVWAQWRRARRTG
ncbi:MAG TPA: hypothetical protein VH475_08120 [Tepidisphaeraceae bacterium]|jgi:hypothetical protein